MSDKFLDISSTLKEAKFRNRIYRVGVELEGFWKGKLPLGVNHLEHDGSVQFEEYICRSQRGDCYDPISGILVGHKGELPSPPLLPEGNDILTLDKWMRLHYPTQVNSTCGLHCHMSFRNAFVYMALMQESYMWTILEFMGQWAKEAVKLKKIPEDHSIFPRLAGKSEYCQHVFMADGQAQKTRKEFDHHGKNHRYTVINFPFARQGTVECRLLPMFATVDIAIEAIREIINITSAFLFETAKKEGVFLDGKVAAKNEKEVEATWIAEGTDATHIERIEVTA